MELAISEANPAHLHHCVTPSYFPSSEHENPPLANHHLLPPSLAVTIPSSKLLLHLRFQLAPSSSLITFLFSVGARREINPFLCDCLHLAPSITHTILTFGFPEAHSIIHLAVASSSYSTPSPLVSRLAEYPPFIRC